jgi:hypothetical protein
MKYYAIIARLNGIPDSAGEILSDDVVLPKSSVPVFEECNENALLGQALVCKNGNILIAYMDLTTVPDDIESMYGVVSGKSFAKDGNVITKWSLTSVGLTKRPADLTLPKVSK